MTKNFILEIKTHIDDSVSKGIQKLKEDMFNYNSNYVKNHKRISIFLKDENELKKVNGGLCAYIQSGVMFVETLILEEQIRNNKWGTKILQTAEKIAREHNCNCIYLDTFTFQALPFYKKLGYEIFAELNHYDDEIVLYWLKKVLN